MKSIFRLIGVIAIVAITILSFTACGKGGATASFRFRNANPPASLSVARTAGPTTGTTINDASFTPFGTYYSGLNGVVGSPYTPTAFNVLGGIISANYSGLGETAIANNHLETIDFVQGTTISLSNELAEGENITAISMYYLYMGGTDSGGNEFPYPTTTFTIAEALHSSHPFRTPGIGNYGTTVSPDGKTITVPTYRLFPEVEAHEQSYIQPWFLYSGTEYKHERRFTHPVFAKYDVGGFVTPWAGITIESGANYTFNVNWNVNGLIVQYQGADGIANTADDVFVFANNFWERFSFTVN